MGKQVNKDFLNPFHQKLYIICIFILNFEGKLPTGNKENYTNCSVYRQNFICFYFSVIFYDVRVMKKKKIRLRGYVIIILEKDDPIQRYIVWVLEENSSSRVYLLPPRSTFMAKAISAKKYNKRNECSRRRAFFLLFIFRFLPAGGEEGGGEAPPAP